MSPRSLFALGATALVGCGPGSARVLTDAAATGIIIREGPAGRETTAYDRRALNPIELEQSSDDYDQLWALSYSEGLESLGLPSGDLTEDPRGQPLPLPDQTASLAFADGWPSRWETVPGLAPALSGLLYRETSPCPDVIPFQRAFPAPEPNVASFALPLDDQHLFLANTAGRFYEVGAEGQVQLTELSTATPHEAGFRAKDGELWLLETDGRLVHGTPRGGFVSGPSLPTGHGAWHALDGSIDGGPLELYALSNRLDVARYSEGSWEVLPSAEVINGTRTRRGIAWAERGLAVVIGRSSNEVVEVRADGTFEVVPIALPQQFNEDAPYSVRQVEGVGVVIGSRYNILLVRRRDHWERLPESTVQPKADILVDLGGGHLISGGDGLLAYWIDGFGYCEAIVFSAGEMRAGARLPGQLFVFGQDAGFGTLISRFELARP